MTFGSLLAIRLFCNTGTKTRMFDQKQPRQVLDEVTRSVSLDSLL